jgi:hypothetical protein
MKRFVLMAGGMLLIAQVLLAGTAGAAYNPQDDQTVNITVPVQLPALNTAEASFNAQQSLNQTISNTTGTSVDYYYIWINVNGQPVLAVDPAKAFM